jgi:hypothetical protein
LNSAEVTQAAERVRILVELTPDIFKFGVMGKSQSESRESGPKKTP